MKAKIQRNQIRYYKDSPIFDSQGNPTGELRDRLQLDITFTEYPDLPTYGINVDVTGLMTKPQLKAAIVVEIKALVAKVKVQILNDAQARQHFDDWGWSDTEFETDSL